MSRIGSAALRAFSFEALAVRNFRLFIAGQVVSVSGTWMQMVAQDWLVLQLTDSGIALGLVTACQFLPMLVLGPWAGVVADRSDKRKLLVCMQAVAAACALILGVLTLTGGIQLWMVFVLAFALGTSSAFDMPTRQAFVFEMVGPQRITNAVSLSSVVMNMGRLVGPAVAGITIASVGMAACFLINAATYLATIGALLVMRKDELHAGPKAKRTAGQLREGLREVWSRPALRTPLLMVLVMGTLTYEWQVSFPLLARFTFDSGPEGYGLLLSAMGLGAVVGGLLVASRIRPSHSHLALAALVFAAAILLAAAMPTLAATAVMATAVGATSIVFVTQANTTLQLTAAPEMRARIMALFGVAFMGTTPIGGPIVGWVGEHFGGRAALALGGVAAAVVGLAAWRSLGRISRDVAQPGALAARRGGPRPDEVARHDGDPREGRVPRHDDVVGDARPAIAK